MTTRIYRWLQVLWWRIECLVGVNRYKGYEPTEEEMKDYTDWCNQVRPIHPEEE